jgi:putative endonuclease
MGPFLFIYRLMFTVYVLYSQKFDQIYIGTTSDLPNRFLSHNELATKGHTIKFRPWMIAYTEEFETKPKALKRIVCGCNEYFDVVAGKRPGQGACRCQVNFPMISGLVI